MSDRFDYFVVLAEMRTGSNFLETNLNGFDGMQCFGEAFNPHFIGYPNKDDILGLTQAQRDREPRRLIETIKAAEGLCGFRYFHDHDARVADLVLDDPRCAKIILTRNPLDSYVSWKIAKSTGQWKLTDVKRRKDAKAQFDADEFAAHVEQLQAFQLRVLNQMQASGQTAFYVAYEDLQSLAVMNGLARWLGVRHQLEGLDTSLKRQNPSPVVDKVENAKEMMQALAGLDRFNLTRTPNFEPRRGPSVPSYVGGVHTPMLYLPVRGGPEPEVIQWMADLDGVDVDGLNSKMSQKQLRKWKRQMSGHRSFTVLRHPVSRIHGVFCRRILNTGEGGFLQIRETLRRQFKMPLPKEGAEKNFSAKDHRAAFELFLAFVKANLAGQTAIRTDADWSTQSQCLSGFGEFALPDLVLRENELAEALPELSRKLGRDDAPEWQPKDAPGAEMLAQIYDRDLEELVADVYQRDYMMFGFSRWDQAA